jgi:hypothetical protein
MKKLRKPRNAKPSKHRYFDPYFFGYPYGGYGVYGGYGGYGGYHNNFGLYNSQLSNIAQNLYNSGYMNDVNQIANVNQYGGGGWW